jgi:hypothetical protein
MANYALTPQTFLPPTSTRPLTVAFTLPSTNAQGTLFPATGLQVSIADVFLDRVTERDVEVTDGSVEGISRCTLRVPHLPRFRGGSVSTTGQYEVKLHAWKGEKLLGSWKVGDLGEEHVGVEV